MLRRSSTCLSILFCRRHFRISPPFQIKSLSNFSNIFCPKKRNPQTPHNFQSSISGQHCRQYSAETDREVDRINLMFAEAREEIESAMDSKETVYFNEEAECARAAVNEVLDLYGGLLGKLPETERAAIQRGMGLKMEQLKAELQQLNE